MGRVKLGLAGALVVLVATGSGCATVTRGRYQAWTIDSAPGGAVVSLSNGERCETPCTLKLRRKYPFAVHVCKVGFHPVNTMVQSQISGAGAMGMAGNVLIGGLVGVGVDAGTGATRDLQPNPLVITLVEEVPGCETPYFPDVPHGGETAEEHVPQGSRHGP